MNNSGFDTAKYYETQMERFQERILPDQQTVIEFGGKPFGDYHASRVLPGYDPDIKAQIIKGVHEELGNNTLAISVHSRDILAAPDGRHPTRRIRGDYGVTYDEEVLRMTEQARDEFDISISAAVVTATPQLLSEDNEEFIASYSEKLGRDFDIVRVLPAIEGYPRIPANRISSELTQEQAVSEPDQSIVVLSPGGGSGKFNVAVTEIAHKLKAGKTPNFIKFETFPVFGLPADHPLNRAFIAATADLANELVLLDSGQTNYDKDVGNFSLLKSLLGQFPHAKTVMHDYSEPVEMGVNVIESGITNEAIVVQACFGEMERRIERYQREIANGQESSATLHAARNTLNGIMASPAGKTTEVIR